MRDILALLVVISAYAPSAEATSPPIVAVFPIEDARPSKMRLSKADLATLTDYLSTKLAEDGAFKLVPDAELEAVLTEKKKESYNQCFDSACQIEIGKQVAAQKSVSTKIVLIGKQCVVITTLFDLRESASERSANHKGACDETALGFALETVAAKLQAPEPKVASIAPPPSLPAAPVVAPPAPFFLWIEAEGWSRLSSGTNPDPTKGADWCQNGGFSGRAHICYGNGATEYDIQMPRTGQHQIWLRYAAEQSRPTNLYFDGALVASDAAAGATGGWCGDSARWVRAATVEARAPGAHTIRLESRAQYWSHIDAILVTSEGQYVPPDRWSTGDRFGP